MVSFESFGTIRYDGGYLTCSKKLTGSQLSLDVDVVDLRAQADASMPASNNNVKLYNISNF